MVMSIYSLLLKSINMEHFLLVVYHEYSCIHVLCIFGFFPLLIAYNVT